MTDENAFPKLLLVLNDNLIIRMFVQHLCKSFEVDIVCDGETAISLLKQKNYSGIIMDIKLGGSKNGIELVQLIRTFIYYKDVPFVALSAFAEPGDKEKFISAGFNYYMAQPFDLPKLTKFFTEALDFSFVAECTKKLILKN